MNKVFLDTDYQHFFEKNGFLLINKQIINDELLSEFRAIRNLLNSEKIDRIQKDFFVGLEHPDKQKVEQINFEINNRIAPILNDFIIDYSPFLSSFISKQPNKDADVFPHQDWSFTDDENLNYAITCWIPLQDTTVDNGCMGLIKGSHLFFNNIRFSPPVATHPSPMSKHKSWILPYFQWLPMVAGSILFFDYRIFHASLPNISNSERLAIGCWLVHKNSSLCHYYLNPIVENELFKYKVDNHFYIKYDNFILSKMYQNKQLIEEYEIVERVYLEDKFMTKKSLKKLIISNGNVHQKLPIHAINNVNYLDSFKHILSKINNFFK